MDHLDLQVLWDLKMQFKELSAARLTKREQFVLAAMHGLLSADTNCDYSPEGIAMRAIEQADEMLAMLGKTQA